MGSLNQVTILGRLGADPEVKFVNERAVCSLSIATDESWKDKQGEKHEKTEWHRCTAWGALAELCGKYLAKGREALVTGKLQTRSWDDKDGKKRYSTEIVADRVVFVGGQGRDANHDQRPAKDNGSQPEHLAGDSDSVPF